MLKKRGIRTLMDSQHAKGAETLHKSTSEYFCNIFWLLWKEISPQNSFFMVSEILRLFVEILTPDYNYSLSVKASV